jgi:hypothetical protein
MLQAGEYPFLNDVALELCKFGHTAPDTLQEEFGELLWPDKITAAHLQSLQVLRRAVPTEASTGRGRRPEEALMAIFAATRLAARFGETADGTIQTP